MRKWKMKMKSHQKMKKKRNTNYSSPSKILQNEVSTLLLYYYKQGLNVDEVITKNISGIPCLIIYRHDQKSDKYDTNTRRKGSGRVSKLNSSVEELIQKYLKENELTLKLLP